MCHKETWKHNTKAHHTKYRFKEPTIIPTQRGGKAPAHGATYYQIGRAIEGLINKHKRGDISDDAYFNQLVTLVTEDDGDLREEAE